MLIAQDLLLATNTLLVGYFFWTLRAFFRAHEKQHARIAEDNRQLVEAIRDLADVYASKASLARAHHRIDEVSAGQEALGERINAHEVRLTVVEDRMACDWHGGE